MWKNSLKIIWPHCATHIFYLFQQLCYLYCSLRKTCESLLWTIQRRPQQALSVSICFHCYLYISPLIIKDTTYLVSFYICTSYYDGFKTNLAFFSLIVLEFRKYTQIVICKKKFWVVWKIKFLNCPHSIQGWW